MLVKISAVLPGLTAFLNVCRPLSYSVNSQTRRLAYNKKRFLLSATMTLRTTTKRNPGVMLWMIMMTLTQVNLCQAKAMLEDHGYKGITVVINRDVPEDKVLLTKLEVRSIAFIHPYPCLNIL